jgi:hypothetical protein
MLMRRILVEPARVAMVSNKWTYVLRICSVGHCGKILATTFDLRGEPALPSDYSLRSFSR